MVTAKAATTELDNDELLALAKYDIEQGNFEAGLLKLKKIAAGKNPPAAALSALARLYARLGLFEAAQTHFEQAIKISPDSELDQFELGMTYYDGGDLKKAVSIWGAILKKNGTHPPALFYSAVCKAQENKPADANSLLETLFAEVSEDNLYYQKGKELHASVNGGSDKVAVPAKRKLYENQH